MPSLPANTMPIVFDRLRIYDTNSDHGLNANELNVMPADDVRSTMIYGIQGSSALNLKPQITNEKAARFFTQLSPNLRSSVLRGWTAYTHSVHEGSFDPFLEQLAKTGIKKLAQDLAKNYETEDPTGIRALTILDRMSKPQTDRLLQELKRTSPTYAHLINDLGRRAIQPKPNIQTSPARSSFPPTHQDAQTALRDIIADKDIQIYGFGETHLSSFALGVPSSAEHFAKEIMPFLVKEKGVSIIGLEFLSSDMSREINSYLETGHLDIEKMPALAFFLQIYSDKGLKAILDQAHSLKKDGYTLKIVGLSCEFKDTMHQMVAKDPTTIQNGITTINQNVTALINDARDHNERIALYNGASHNDAKDVNDDWRISYVEQNRLSPESFLAVDLIVPEQQSNPQIRNLLFEMAPAEGVILKHDPDQYRITFAKGKTSASTPNMPRILEEPTPNFTPFFTQEKLDDLFKISPEILLKKSAPDKK